MELELEGRFWGLTEEGRCLIVRDDGPTTAELELHVHHRGNGVDLGNDVILANLRLADSDGRVWQAASLVTADVFMERMFDFSQSRCFDLCRFDDQWRRAAGLRGTLASVFERAMRDALVLQDLHCGVDDRCSRTMVFQVEERSECVQAWFKHSLLVFDVAVPLDREDSGFFRNVLAVRVNVRNPDALWDVAGNDVGPFGFLMDPRHLLANNAASCDGQAWRRSNVSRPLVFRCTPDRAAPQSHVTIVDYSRELWRDYW